MQSGTSGAGSTAFSETTVSNLDTRWLITFVGQIAVGLALVTLVEGGREYGLSLLGMALGQGLTAQMTLKKPN